MHKVMRQLWVLSRSAKGGLRVYRLFGPGLQCIAPATKNEPGANCGPDFVQACAGETHMDIEGQFLCENLQQEFLREFMD